MMLLVNITDHTTLHCSHQQHMKLNCIASRRPGVWFGYYFIRSEKIILIHNLFIGLPQSNRIGIQLFSTSISVLLARASPPLSPRLIDPPPDDDTEDDLMLLLMEEVDLIEEILELGLNDFDEIRELIGDELFFELVKLDAVELLSSDLTLASSSTSGSSTFSSSSSISLLFLRFLSLEDCSRGICRSSLTTSLSYLKQ